MDPSAVASKVSQGAEKQKTDVEKEGLQLPAAGQTQPSFPAQYYAKHPLEDRAQAIATAQAMGLVDLKQNDDNLFQKPVFDSEAVDFVKKKKEQEDLRVFEEWLHQKYDLNDPLQVRFIKEKYPSYWERRVAQLDSDLKIAKRLAIMNLLGPQNEEDLYLQFQLDQGELNVARFGSIIDPKWQNQDDSKLIKRGVFNPRSYISTATKGAPDYVKKKMGYVKETGKPTGKVGIFMKGGADAVAL